VVTGVAFAGVIGWISYTDALFVTRLAGNSGGIAYAYPSIPDGLIIFSLLALVEGARMRPPQRSGWATFGLGLGAAMTLAANVGAGLEHSLLDAFIDGLIPVCFFVAVEIVLWHVRRARGNVAGGISHPSGLAGSPATQPVAVPPDNLKAAEVSMAETARAGNPWSQNQLRKRFSLTHTEARTLWRKYEIPVKEIAPTLNVPAGAADPPGAPAGAFDVPAGVPPRNAPAPAGTPSMNGHGRG
jgi:hypothetical protein